MKETKNEKSIEKSEKNRTPEKEPFFSLFPVSYSHLFIRDTHTDTTKHRYAENIK